MRFSSFGTRQRNDIVTEAFDRGVHRACGCSIEMPHPHNSSQASTSSDEQDDNEADEQQHDAGDDRVGEAVGHGLAERLLLGRRCDAAHDQRRHDEVEADCQREAEGRCIGEDQRNEPVPQRHDDEATPEDLDDGQRDRDEELESHV